MTFNVIYGPSRILGNFYLYAPYVHVSDDNKIVVVSCNMIQISSYVY